MFDPSREPDGIPDCPSLVPTASLIAKEAPDAVEIELDCMAEPAPFVLPSGLIDGPGSRMTEFQRTDLPPS